jgi:plasmid stabilization system protein ParE
MGNRIAITPEAKHKLAEAFQWYESKQVGLGHEFLRAFSACFGLVERQPEIFPVVKGYRKGLPRKFPYTFFYRCESGVVTVYQIFHCSEDSRKWTKGL